MIQQCIDLLLGRAFTPDSQDAVIPLARRFARRPLVAITSYKDGFEAVAITFEGAEPRFGQPEFCPAGAEEADANFVRSFALKHKAKDCLFNLATGYTAVLSNRTRRAENDQEALLLMRDNPERLLGEAPTANCRHSLAYHPTHSFAVVFAHKETEINNAVGLASRAGLNIARIQCGMASLLMYLLGRYWNEVGAEAEILLVERTAVLYQTVSESGMGRPLFDVGLKEAALKQAIDERVGKLRPGGKVILVDSSGLDVAAMIAAKGDFKVVAPLAGDSHPALRACCSDEPHLGYDLYPGERSVRPFASAKLRVVPLIFWGAAAAAAAVFAIDAVRESRDSDQAARFKSQEKMLADGKKRSQNTIADIQTREKLAGSICDWLLISPPAQSLLIRITDEVKAATDEGAKENRPVAQVGSLSVTLQEGQPQMRLVLVLLGDASAANRVFQRVSALLARLGYSTVDERQTLVPQGFRFEQLVNMPKATHMKAYTFPAAVLVVAGGAFLLLLLGSVKGAHQADLQLADARRELDTARLDLLNVQRAAATATAKSEPADRFLDAWKPRVADNANIEEIFGRLDTLAVDNLLSPSGKTFTVKPDYFFDGRHLSVQNVNITVAGDYIRTLNWLGAVEAAYPAARVEQISYTMNGNSLALAAQFVFPKSFDTP